MPLEVLHFAFVFLGRRLRVERAEVATLASLRIFLVRVQTILSRLQFSNHYELLADKGSNQSTRNVDHGPTMTGLCVQVVTVPKQSLEHMSI